MENKKNSNYRELTVEEKRVILDKATELPFSGKYTDFFQKGTYRCKQCNAALYKSDNKFHSSCGWPSFDDEIAGAIEKKTDSDGMRTEILCANCGAHLGHIFTGEGFTDKNIRHCVNSISMVFEADKEESIISKAYLAGGCFWGIEHFFQQKKGVLSAVSGYMGGNKDNPTYHEVCYENTGHLETVEVTYDSSKTTYEEIIKYFFDIHDPTQKNGQGPDIGEQYLSAIFYTNLQEKEIALNLINILKSKGYDVVTDVREKKKFWKAEDYHQDYYEKTDKTPYCHFYRKKF